MKIKRWLNVQQVGTRLGLKRTMVTNLINQYQKDLGSELWKVKCNGGAGYKFLLSEKGIQILRGFRMNEKSSYNEMIVREIQLLKRDVRELKIKNNFPLITLTTANRLPETIEFSGCDESKAKSPEKKGFWARLFGKV